MFRKYTFDQLDSFLCPADDLIDVRLQVGDLFFAQRLIDAAGNRAGAMNTFT